MPSVKRITVVARPVGGARRRICSVEVSTDRLLSQVRRSVCSAAGEVMFDGGVG